MRGWPYARVLAHRCGGRLAPENTLAGLDAAAAVGCGGIEFDVMLSGSGTPVLIHDETLDRTTDGRGRVAQTPDEVIFSLDAGVRKGERFAGERVPRFDAAALRCIELGLHANVEIKPSQGYEAETGRAVAEEAARLWSRAECPPLLSSFSEIALAAAAEAAPHLPRGLLVGRVPRDWRARCERLGAVALHVNCRHLGTREIAAIREAGLWLVVYTENDPVRAANLLDAGVDCVITDRPDFVRAPA